MLDWGPLHDKLRLDLYFCLQETGADPGGGPRGLVPPLKFNF